MEEIDKFWKSFQHRTRLPSVPSETSLCSIMRRRSLPHLFSRFSLLSTLYASTSFLFSPLFAREICKPSTMVLPVFLISGYINQSITNHGIQPSVWPLVNKRQRQRETEPPWRLSPWRLVFPNVEHRPMANLGKKSNVVSPLYDSFSIALQVWWRSLSDMWAISL